IRPAWRRARATSRLTSRGLGRPIALVKTPLQPSLAPFIRIFVQVPMRWAHHTIFDPYAGAFRTDRKTASCPTAMRVCTLGRIGSRKMVREAIPPRLRPPQTTQGPYPECLIRTGRRCNGRYCRDAKPPFDVPDDNDWRPVRGSDVCWMVPARM